MIDRGDGPVVPRPRIAIIDRLEAAAFNKQMAGYRSKDEDWKKEAAAYDGWKDQAEILGVVTDQIKLAELRGKLRAAMEERATEDVKEFQKLLSNPTGKLRDEAEV